MMQEAFQNLGQVFRRPDLGDVRCARDLCSRFPFNQSSSIQCCPQYIYRVAEKLPLTPYIETADAVGSETILRVYYLDEETSAGGAGGPCAALPVSCRVLTGPRAARLSLARAKTASRARSGNVTILERAHGCRQRQQYLCCLTKCCQAVTTRAQRCFKSALGFMRDTT